MKTNVRAGVDAAKNGDGADKEEDNREEEEEKSIILRNRERESRLRRMSRDEQSVLLPGFVLRPDGD